MKKLLLGFLVLFAFAAQAQIVPSIPYTLTNGSLADATQVMGNFNTIVTDVNANAATNGANTNITAITGLTTPLANTYGGTVIYTGGTTGGSANVQTLATVVPNNYANTAGNIVTGIAGFTNTTSPTLAVNAQTAKQTAVNTPLGLISTPANTLVTGQGFLALFDGTYFEILSAPPNSVANSQLALMSNSTLKGNISGADAVPSNLTLASVAVSGSLIKKLDIQTITSTGTYTPAAGLVYAVAECEGSGGSGGSGFSSASGSSGGAGGAGEYGRAILSAAAIGASQTATVGAAATGGTSGNNGADGSTTSLGSLLSCAGGKKGLTGTSGLAAGGLGGNAAGAGDFHVPGQPGGWGNGALATGVAGSYGGSGYFGAGGVGAITTNTAGGNGLGYGSGGASGTGSGAGGNSAPGVLVITEFTDQ